MSLSDTRENMSSVEKGRESQGGIMPDTKSGIDPGIVPNSPPLKAGKPVSPVLASPGLNVL